MKTTKIYCDIEPCESTTDEEYTSDPRKQWETIFRGGENVHICTGCWKTRIPDDPSLIYRAIIRVDQRAEETRRVKNEEYKELQRQGIIE